MPILSSLKTAKITSKPSNDPVLVRRQKLASKLREQAEGAEALIANAVFECKKVISKKRDDGRRERVEVPKRFRPWFWHDSSGTWYIELLYGVRALPVGKNGETTIVVGVKENLPKLIRSLVAAVDSGELDAQMAGVPKRRKAA